MSESPNWAMRIRVPREEARGKLREQIDKGEQLSHLNIKTPINLEDARNEYNNWHDYVKDLLLSLFTTEKMYQDFVTVVRPILISPTFEQERVNFRDHLTRKLAKLKSIMDRLDLFQEDIVTTSASLSKNVKVSSDKEVVFVVHGRNEKLKESMFDFLRAIGLNPLEWSKIKAEAMRETEQGAPYVGAIVNEAFKQAQGIIVLLSGDDMARLREEFLTDGDPAYESELMPQARPNVLFEGGMAMGISLKKTIWVEVGRVRPFSDIFGRHVIHLDNSLEKRYQLVQALQTIQCKVDVSGSSWLTAGKFIDAPDSNKRDTNQRESTSEQKKPSAAKRTIPLTQARHLKKRIKQVLEDGDSTLAPDFVVELDRLFLDAYSAYDGRYEIFSMELEFKFSYSTKLNDKLGLLKSTLNSVERLILLLEELG